MNTRTPSAHARSIIRGKSSVSTACAVIARATTSASAAKASALPAE